MPKASQACWPAVSTRWRNIKTVDENYLPVVVGVAVAAE
jgi:hypothetical protein